jgi:hypothetical protein
LRGFALFCGVQPVYTKFSKLCFFTPQPLRFLSVFVAAVVLVLASGAEAEISTSSPASSLSFSPSLRVGESEERICSSAVGVTFSIFLFFVLQL